mmetsp:Transcript_22984/g.39354  ORF Transcript_22984/g.39354 Transcript_22984/m.39354 type:complete len:95 (+) Transcript_22984:242-526(+)
MERKFWDRGRRLLEDGGHVEGRLFWSLFLQISTISTIISYHELQLLGMSRKRETIVSYIWLLDRTHLYLQSIQRFLLAYLWFYFVKLNEKRDVK